MTAQNPVDRPDAQRAYAVWQEIRGSISGLARMWRLQSRQEVWAESLIKDGIALIGKGARVSKGIFSWLSDIQG